MKWPLDKPVPHLSLFLLPLTLEYLDGCSWRLVKPFTFGSVTLERVIELPEGFQTDFASIPRVFWNLLPPTGSYGKAAVIHDFLYRTPFYATRAQADLVLLEAMTDLGVGWWTRQIIYRGVRLGGRRAWKGYAAIPIVTLDDVDRMTR